MNILFDLDDTIYNLMEPFERVHQVIYPALYQKALETIKEGQTPVPVAPDQVDVDWLFMRFRQHSDQILPLEHTGDIDPKDTFYERLVRTYGDLNVPISREDGDEYEKLYRSYQKDIHIPEGTITILDYCHDAPEITMGILTNGRVSFQGSKVETLHLSKWFDKDHIFISQAVGYEKPEVETFLTIQKKLDVNPDDTWYVGDTYVADILGAKRAGWHAIWYNHRGRDLLAEAKKGGFTEADINQLGAWPDQTIKSEEALYRFIKDLNEDNKN
ncbi:MAG: HAD family hydrolase [Lachnospiraceae bacterium]|nr:HAD family hydrolase [Lachnospiraceae bacterium]